MIWILVKIFFLSWPHASISSLSMIFWTCALLTFLQIFSLDVAQECPPCDCRVVNASANCIDLDPCSCCLRCNGQVGEACGGRNGRCAAGLFCLPDDPYQGEEGTCYGKSPSRRASLGRYGDFIKIFVRARARWNVVCIYMCANPVVSRRRGWMLNLRLRAKFRTVQLLLQHFMPYQNLSLFHGRGLWTRHVQ